MAALPPSFLTPTQPLYLPYYASVGGVGPNLQVSTLTVAGTGNITLTAAAPLLFQDNTVPTTYTALEMITNTGITPANQVAVLDVSKTYYKPLAVAGLSIYGVNTVGTLPVATLVEDGVSNNLTITSAQVNISTLNCSRMLNVSTINGTVYGALSPDLIASTLFVRNTATISTLNVSTLNATSAPIVASNIQTTLASIDKAFMSTVEFNPTINGSLGGVDLGMGQFLGGIAGGFGSGVMNTTIAGLALGTGIAALTLPRSGNNINPTTFETINGTTQLQFSTIGIPTTTVTRLVSSIGPTVAGKERYISSIIPAGTTCIRSMSDPLNLANATIATSTLQSFGQWQPLPILSSINTLTVSTLTVDKNAIVYNLIPAFIDGFSWDTIQYQNQAPVNMPGYVVTSDNCAIPITFKNTGTSGTSVTYTTSIRIRIGVYNDINTLATYINQAFTNYQASDGTFPFRVISWTSNPTNLQFYYNTSTATGTGNIDWTFTGSFLSPYGITAYQTAQNQILLGGLALGTQSLVAAYNVRVALVNPPTYTYSYSTFIPFGPNIKLETLFTPYINSYAWSTISCYNQQPINSAPGYEIIDGVNNQLPISYTINNNPVQYTLGIMTPGLYSFNGLCSAIQTAINNAIIYLNPALAPYPVIIAADVFSDGRIEIFSPDLTPTGYTNWISLLIFDSNFIGSFPTITLGQMSAAALLVGAVAAYPNNFYYLFDINQLPYQVQVFENVPDSTTMYYYPTPFGSDIQVSSIKCGGDIFSSRVFTDVLSSGEVDSDNIVNTGSLTTNQLIVNQQISTLNIANLQVSSMNTLATQTSTINVSTINGYNWDTISFQNQGSGPGPAQGFVVESINQRFQIFINGYYVTVTIPAGSYNTGVALAAAITTGIQAQSAKTGTLACAFSAGRLSFFINTPTFSIYYAVNALFPGSVTAAQLQQNALLLGAVYGAAYGPAFTIILPNAPVSISSTGGPPVRFGPNLQVSSMMVNGNTIVENIQILSVNQYPWDNIQFANQVPQTTFAWTVTGDNNQIPIKLVTITNTFYYTITLAQGQYTNIAQILAQLNQVCASYPPYTGLVWTAPSTSLVVKDIGAVGVASIPAYTFDWTYTGVGLSEYGLTALETAANAIMMGAVVGTIIAVPKSPTTVTFPQPIPIGAANPIPFGPYLQLSTLTLANNSGLTGFPPLGAIMLFASGSASLIATQYLICNGASVNKVAFPALFGVIGYTYGGTGNVFNLPTVTAPVANTGYYIRVVY